MVLGGKSLINVCSPQERDSGGNDPEKQGHGTDHRGGRVLTRLSRGYPQLLSLPWFQSIFQVCSFSVWASHRHFLLLITKTPD